MTAKQIILGILCVFTIISAFNVMNEMGTEGIIFGLIVIGLCSLGLYKIFNNKK